MGYGSASGRIGVGNSRSSFYWKRIIVKCKQNLYISNNNINKKKGTMNLSSYVLRPASESSSSSSSSATTSSSSNSSSSIGTGRSVFPLLPLFRRRSNNYYKRENFWQWYSRMLDTNPIITKCISAGLISSTGNILSQCIDDDKNEENGPTTCTSTKEEKNGIKEGDNSSIVGISSKSSIDWNQVGRFGFLNVIFVAPILHYWYNFINKAVPGKSMVQVMKRVFFDEFVFTPMYLPIFLTALWTLEDKEEHEHGYDGHGHSQHQHHGSDNNNNNNNNNNKNMNKKTIPKMLYDEMPGIMMAEWVLWVPTMTLTFRFVPVKYQVLLINSVGVVWHTFLSYAARNASSVSSSSSSSISSSQTSQTQKQKEEHDDSDENVNNYHQHRQRQLIVATTTTTATAATATTDRGL